MSINPRASKLIARHLAAIRNSRNDDQLLATAATVLAADLWKVAKQLHTSQDKRQARRLARMMQDPAGKAFTLHMADRILRLNDPARAADVLRHIIQLYDIPSYLSPWQRFLLNTAASLSKWAPSLIMARIHEQLRKDSSRVIMPAKHDLLQNYLQKRQNAGYEININLLGEAVLGQSEAHRRLESNLELLSNPNVTHLSIKISAIDSRIHSLAFNTTLQRIEERLRRIYSFVLENPLPSSNGQPRYKRITLDMEDYSEAWLTLHAFLNVSNEEAFLPLENGIALQAYLPETNSFLDSIFDAANQRAKRGGAPLHIRLVKGANLAMEHTLAEMHGWFAAPFTSKREVDSHFKLLLHRCIPNLSNHSIQLGIGSHNLFDIAYALLLRERENVCDSVHFEMLEGMANHIAEAIRQTTGSLLLYSPVVHKEDFHNAMAYLIRRLDENTGEENFLRDLFSLQPGDRLWKRQADRFLKSSATKDKLDLTCQRCMDRSEEGWRLPSCSVDEGFFNEPDTDWTQKANRDWIADHLSARKKRPPERIPVLAANNEYASPLPGTGTDPSRPGHVSYKYAHANESQIDEAITSANNALNEWTKRTHEQRKELLHQCARIMGKERGETIACMVEDGGKAVTEADSEVSEAIDFAHYYARCFDDIEALEDVESQPLGVVLITPPWNFPYAIPASGIFAALMAGNTVLFKPAPETVLTGWQLANQLWRAGIPRDVLHFIPCSESETGRKLITDRRLHAIILTGSHTTAEHFLKRRPTLPLFAETSGKNAIFITANADLDLAIRDLVHSAFSHAGQKCSAASLAIVEAEVHDNPAFRRQLRDAVASLKTGSAWDPDSDVTPLIKAPEGPLKTVLNTLEPGQEWLVRPQMVDNNPCLWSPGVLTGVQPGSWYHRNECFGPILGIIRAKNFEHGLTIQNDSAFGLTAGLHSLDEREIHTWSKHIAVGNAYINRSITGAIVRRQPFGGWKHSAYGPGAKAGGPNYPLRLCHWEQSAIPKHDAEVNQEVSEILQTAFRWLKEPIERDIVAAAAKSYQHFWDKIFRYENDPSALKSERNFHRYVPFTNGVLLRLKEPREATLIAGAVMASIITGVPLELSIPHPSGFADALGIDTTIESEDSLALRLRQQAGRYDLLRSPQGCVPELNVAANTIHLPVVNQTILANGRLELLNYLREQTISKTLHRYGNRIPTPGEIKNARTSAPHRT